MSHSSVVDSETAKRMFVFCLFLMSNMQHFKNIDQIFDEKIFI